MFRKTLILCCSVIALAACQTPNAVPSGYTYHSQTYKSETPPAPPRISPVQRSKMGPQQAQQYRDALYDLVDDLTERAGLPPKLVHVIPHTPMNAFYGQVDNDLREAMRHIGYELATSGEDGYFFTYAAELIKQDTVPTSEYPELATPMGNNVEIILQVFDGQSEDAKMLTEQRGQYRIDGAEDYFGPQIPDMIDAGFVRED